MNPDKSHLIVGRQDVSNILSAKRNTESFQPVELLGAFFFKLSKLWDSS